MGCKQHKEGGMAAKKERSVQDQQKCVGKLLAVEGIQLDLNVRSLYLCFSQVFSVRLLWHRCAPVAPAPFWLNLRGRDVMLTVVTRLSSLLRMIQGKKVPRGKGFASSPSSQALENGAQNRASSQGKQLCVPNCPTTSLSLLQCLVWAEKRPRAEEKVPPVDYYYFFFVVAAPWVDKKKHPQLWCYVQVQKFGAVERCRTVGHPYG